MVSSGSSSEVYGGKAVASESRAVVVVASKGPAPEGSSGGSFHSVGTGPCGYSAGRQAPTITPVHEWAQREPGTATAQPGPGLQVPRDRWSNPEGCETHGAEPQALGAHPQKTMPGLQVETRCPHSTNGTRETITPLQQTETSQAPMHSLHCPKPVLRGPSALHCHLRSAGCQRHCPSRGAASCGPQSLNFPLPPPPCCAGEMKAEPCSDVTIHVLLFLPPVGSGTKAESPPCLCVAELSIPCQCLPCSGGPRRERETFHSSPLKPLGMSH